MCRMGTVGQINYGAAKSGVLGITMSAAGPLPRANSAMRSMEDA